MTGTPDTMFVQSLFKNGLGKVRWSKESENVHKALNLLEKEEMQGLYDPVF